MGSCQFNQPLVVFQLGTTHISKSAILYRCTIQFKEVIEQFESKYVNYIQKDQYNRNSTDFNGLQQIIRAFFIGILKQNIIKVNQNQITMKQAKIQISYLFMQVKIHILKYLLKNHTKKEINEFFQAFQYFLSILLGHLKTIYPRGQSNQAGELSKEFKQFDYTYLYQHDPLSTQNDVCFNSAEEFQITKTIKILLNNLIQELDQKYPDFEKIIKDIDQQFKVGRKISENTAKYTLLETGLIQIKSSEIARVLIKWVDELEQMVKKPEQSLRTNQFRVYTRIQVDQDKKKTNQMKQSTSKNLAKQDDLFLSSKLGKTSLSMVVQDGLCTDIAMLQDRQRFLYKNVDKQYFRSFTIDLIEMFLEIRLNKHQISRQMMEVVKLSAFASKYISWIVEQKLIKFIKILVKAANKHQNSDEFIDLVKFGVKDLMRCQIHGNRKKIRQVFSKFKQSNLIEIIKIKNRFSTPMSDAMIFFKIKNSYIVCECQLILSQEKSKEDSIKDKNIENINHFLYELQRSKFGFLGQLSVFLKNKSETVSIYCEKIDLEIEDKKKAQIQKLCNSFLTSADQLQQNENKLIIEKLRLNHSGNTSQKAAKAQNLQSHQEQNKSVLYTHSQSQYYPFVCSYCFGYQQKYFNTGLTTFINVLLNGQTDIKVCIFCQNQIIKEQRQKAEKELTKKRAHEYLMDKWNRQKQENKKNQSAIVNEYLQLKYYRQIYKNNKNLLQRLLEKSRSYFNRIKELTMTDNRNGMVKAIDLIKVFKNVDYEAINAGWKIYFTSIRKIGDMINTKLYKYDSEVNTISNVLYPLQKYQKYELFQVNPNQNFYLINGLKRQNYSDLSVQIKEKFYEGFPLFYSKQKIRRKLNQAKKDQSMVYYLQQEFILIDLDLSVKKKNNKGWLKQYMNELTANKNCNNIINLPKSALTIEDLNQVKSKFDKIQIINVSNNYLKSISPILQKCFLLEELDVSNNNLSSLCFSQELLYFKKLIAQNNYLKKIQKFKNIKNIACFSLKNNLLQKFNPEVSMTKLQKLILNSNPLKQFYAQNVQTHKQLHLDSTLFKYSNFEQISNKRTQFSIVNLLNFKDKKSQDIQQIQKRRKSNEKCKQISPITKFPQVQYYNQVQNLFIYIDCNKNPLSQWLYQISKNESYLKSNIRLLFFNSKFQKEDYIKKVQHLQSGLEIAGQKKEIKKKQQQKPYTIERNSNNLNKAAAKSKFESEKKVLRKEERKEERIMQNQLYLLHVFARQGNGYYGARYTESEFPGLYDLAHYGQKMNFEDFFRFNWKNIIYIDISNNKLGDEEWKTFTKNFCRYPYLRTILIRKQNIYSIENNEIRSIDQGDLQQFKNLQFVRFHYDQDSNNPFSSGSQNVLRRFNKKYRPQKWIIADAYDDRSYEDYVLDHEMKRKSIF